MADLEQTTEKEKTLFIIEDDKPFRERLTTSFQRKDFVVTAAANKKEALEVLTQHDFNYAIVDLRLGDGSGLDVIKVIKEKNPECRAVMLTSYKTNRAFFVFLPSRFTFRKISDPTMTTSGSAKSSCVAGSQADMLM